MSHKLESLLCAYWLQAGYIRGCPAVTQFILQDLLTVGVLVKVVSYFIDMNKNTD